MTLLWEFLPSNWYIGWRKKNRTELLNAIFSKVYSKSCWNSKMKYFNVFLVSVPTLKSFRWKSAILQRFKDSHLKFTKTKVAAARHRALQRGTEYAPLSHIYLPLGIPDWYLHSGIHRFPGLGCSRKKSQHITGWLSLCTFWFTPVTFGDVIAIHHTS